MTLAHTIVKIETFILFAIPNIGMKFENSKVLLGSIIVLSIYIVYLGKFFILPAITAALLAYLCYPIYHKLNRKTNRPGFSSIMTVTALLIAILIPLFFTVKHVIMEAISFYGYLRSISPYSLARDTQGWLEYLGIYMGLDAITAQFQSFLQLLSTGIFKGIQFISSGIASTLFQIGFTLIFLYFFLIYGKKIYRYLELFFPFSEKGKKQLTKTIESDIRALFLGQGLIAIIQGFIGGIGFWLFGIPNPVFWGVVMAFLSIIPPFGTAIIWFPALLFLFYQESYFLAAGLLLWSIIITSNIDNLLRPYIVGKITKMSFLTVLLGVILGLNAFNLIGVVLGPLLISILIILSKIYYTEYMEKPQASSSSKR